MLLLGCLGKFGALFTTIPDPVIGGMFMVTFGKGLGFFTVRDLTVISSTVKVQINKTDLFSDKLMENQGAN